MKKLTKKQREELSALALKYSYRVNWSEEDQLFICGPAELPSLLCHGSTPEAALKESKLLVVDTLEEKSRGREEIPEPFSLKKYSGKFVVRTTEDLHRRLSVEAQEKGVSINKLVNSKLAAG